jgi:hypothetical protein
MLIISLYERSKISSFWPMDSSPDAHLFLFQLRFFVELGAEMWRSYVAAGVRMSSTVQGTTTTLRWDDRTHACRFLLTCCEFCSGPASCLFLLNGSELTPCCNVASVYAYLTIRSIVNFSLVICIAKKHDDVKRDRGLIVICLCCSSDLQARNMAHWTYFGAEKGKKWLNVCLLSDFFFATN